MFKAGDLVQIRESTGGNPPGMVYNQTYVVLATYRRGTVQYVIIHDTVKDLDTYRSMDQGELDRMATNGYEYNELEVFNVFENKPVRTEGKFFD